MPPSLSLAGAVDYWMTCRPLWFRPAPLIYGVPPIFAYYSIGRCNLLNATHLLFLPIIPLAGAIYWMPQSTILLGRRNSSLNAVLLPISHLASAVYWMPHAIPDHGIPDPEDWARTISWIAWALFAQECPVSCTCQGWFPCTYPYPWWQSQVRSMLTNWTETLLLLPSIISIPQHQAQLRLSLLHGALFQ